MTDWTAGYVADINYTYGFYRELTPAMLAFVALARSRRAPSLQPGATYCELGCGQGFSANLLAAANPDIEFYATDFNPAQIAGANALAAEGGAPNIHFSDASFQQYIDDPSLPQFDFITLHGIYSWVSAENRKAIVDFIARKLKVGGFVYISYNTLPGWAAAMPLRRLFTDHAGTTGGTLLSRIEKALVFADRMREANAAYFRDTNGVAQRLKNIQNQNRNYLAHEYFNKDWTPLYFSDVAGELDAAKLGHLGSAHLLDHIDGVNFTPAHLGLLNEIGDPLFRETARDYLTQQQFRRDVFARGVLEMNAGENQAAWLDLRLALIAPADAFNYSVNGPLGSVSLQEEVYKPMIEALSKGPRTVRQLMAEPAVKDFNWPKLREAATVLIGSGQVQPCLDAKGDAARAKRTRAFNTAVMKRSTWSGELNYLASPITGGGVSVDRFQQMFLLALQEKQADPAAHAWSQISAQGQKLLKDGKPLQTAEENLAELRQRYEAFSKILPVMQQVGIA
jgi:cyclopropane fatty-acyl-phospholipid synthase-like methyltransferase